MLNLTVGQTYNSDVIEKHFGLKNRGGIRYSRRWPNIKNLTVILSEGQAQDSIYPDRISKDVVLEYVGEGPSGDQKLQWGNRALTWGYLQREPVRVLRRVRVGILEDMGQFRIDRVETRVHMDKSLRARGAFVFVMRKV